MPLWLQRKDLDIYFKDSAAELENFCKVFRERFQGPPAHSRKPEKGFKALCKEKKDEKILNKK